MASSRPPAALTARLILPAGVRLLQANDQIERTLDHLAGRVSQHTSFAFSYRHPNQSRGHVEWLGAAPVGTALAITVRAAKAGTRRATVLTGD